MFRVLQIAFLGLLLTGTVKAQFLEDALRIARPTEAAGARSAAMGNAFIGVADDFSAIHWNPAGLGLIRESEFAIGLTNLSVDNDATYLGITTPYENSTTHLSSIGMVLPFPVQRGSFVLAAGYNRLANYAGALRTDGFNPYSSIQRSLYDDTDSDYDLAWNLGLEDTILFTYQDQGIPGWNAITINKNVYQVQDVLESGNLGQWSFGGSMEVARDMFVGVTLNVLSGTYRYDRTFLETDPGNLHSGTIVGYGNRARTDFQSLEINQLVNQDIGGWNAKFGFLYKVQDIARVGVTVQSPYSVTVTESYDVTGLARFGTGLEEFGLPTSNSEYDISTGWVFGLGASVTPVSFVRISADVEFPDYSLIEFGDGSDASFNRLNKDLKRELRATTNYRIGAEVTVPGTSLQVRGGYSNAVSPYSEDAKASNATDFDTKTFAAGLGYTLPNNFQINATLQSSSFSAYRMNYPDPDTNNVPDSALRIDEATTRMSLIFSIAYRF